MSRSPLATLATVVAISMAAATPTLAQQGQGGAASPGREGTVPSQLDAGQIKLMQLKLNQLGFSSGHVDGIWGPETSTAVLHFQQVSHLQATGKLNDETLKALGLAGAATASSAAAAQAVLPQATPAPTAPTPALPVLGAPTQPTTGTSAGVTSGRATDSTSGAAPGASPGSNAGSTAAGGPNNQAVATTSANAPQPAHGANSFTKGEAQRRITREGFQNVGDLSKDNAGVWRGRAVKNGQPARVWLDYKGNVGQE